MFRNRMFVASMVAAMVGCGVALVATGTEVQVPSPAEDRGDVVIPADNQAPAPAAQRRQGNDADWFRGPSYREESAGSSNGEFPSAELHDFVNANARAAAARMMFRRAESALSASVRDAKRKFESSPELKQALAAEKEAHANYDAARKDALAAVVSDPRYQAILAMHQDLGHQIQARRENLEGAAVYPVVADPVHPQAGELFAMAALRMQVVGARAMERVATASSDEVSAARERLVAAGDKVTELRQNFDTAFRNDTNQRAIRHAALEDARISKVVAAAYLRGSRMAAEEAVNFAYFLHRYDYMVSYDPYADYGYGSQYGYGYRYGRY